MTSTALRHRIESLNHDSQAPGFWDDQERAQKLLRERAGYEGTVEQLREAVARGRTTCPSCWRWRPPTTTSRWSPTSAGQLPALVAGVRKLELMRMLSGPEDKSDAIVSIHPGMGGVDAQDWAEMLMRMYLRWCERKGFKTEILEHQPGDEAGIKDVSFTVSGPNAYGFLRSENGVHRLIRISPFDANARRQTSFAAVFVVPDLDDDIGDIEIQHGGPQGRHLPRQRRGRPARQQDRVGGALHAHPERHRGDLPAGALAAQEPRAGHEDAARPALREGSARNARLPSRSAYGGSNKSDIDMGSQIRSYTMSPYTLVKDERTEHKVTQVDKVLDGDLDEFIEAYLLMKANRKAQAERARQLIRAPQRPRTRYVRGIRRGVDPRASRQVREARAGRYAARSPTRSAATRRRGRRRWPSPPTRARARALPGEAELKGDEPSYQPVRPRDRQARSVRGHAHALRRHAGAGAQGQAARARRRPSSQRST